MNILHLNDGLSLRGGADVYIEELLKILAERNCTGTWLSVSSGRDKQYRSSAPSIQDNLFEGDFESWGEWFRKFVDEHGFDIIHVHHLAEPKVIDLCLSLRPVVRSLHSQNAFCPGGGKFLRFSERACLRAAGLHCVVHAYTEGCCNRHPVRLFSALEYVRFEMQEASKRYEHIVAMSSYMKCEAIKAGFPEDRITCIPCFTPLVAEVATTGDNMPRLLFVGRFIIHKGLHLMLRAVIPLLRRYPELAVDIVGDGIIYPKMRSELEEAKRAGVDNRIVFHGWLDRVAIGILFRGAYATLFPSIYPEAFGIVGIESLMHGKPVVAFDVGGVREWMQDGKCGFLVPPGNVSAFAGRITQLLENKDLYGSMRRAARELAIARFAPDRHASRMLAIYQNALL